MHLKNFPKRLDSKTSSLRITVPENLDLALEGLIRKVLREQPKTDYIHSFAAEYFETLVKIRDKAGAKYTSEQLCPFHNDEDAHEMIKLANTFNKSSKKNRKESPQGKDKMVESGANSRRAERPKGKKGKQTTPDLIKKLPGNRPKEEKKERQKENQEEELLTGDPIKELVEKELELEALAKRTKGEGNDEAAGNTEGDRSDATEEKKRTDGAEEPTDGEEVVEIVKIPAEEETVAKDEHPGDETETKKTEETPLEAKVINGEPIEDKSSTTEKDSEMTDSAAEEKTAVKKDDEGELQTVKEDRTNEMIDKVNTVMMELALKEAKEEEKEPESSPRQLKTGSDGTEPQSEKKSYSAKEDKGEEVQGKIETESNIEAEEARVEETLKTASALTEDTDEQKINAENADQQKKQQEATVEEKQQEPGVEQKQQELGVEQKQQELGVEQKQQEATEEQRKPEAGLEQKQQEATVEQKEQKAGAEQKKPEAELEQKQHEAIVEQKEQDKEQELVVEQKKSEAEMEQEQQELGLEPKQEELGVEQKLREATVEQKEQDPGVGQKTPEAGMEWKEEPESDAQQRQPEQRIEEKQSKRNSEGEQKNSESEEKTPPEENTQEQTETATEAEPHSSEKTDTAEPKKEEKSKIKEEAIASKENVTGLNPEAEDMTPKAEEMLSKEDKPDMLKPKENDNKDNLDRAEQQEKDDGSKADSSATEELLKEPEDVTAVKEEAGKDEGDKAGDVEEAKAASQSTSGTAAVEKAEEPEPQADTTEIQNEKQKDELSKTIDKQQGATEDDQEDEAKPPEEELCTVVDSHHIIRIEEPEAVPDDLGVAPTPEEVQIKTIQTHYYDALQVPEILTKQFRVHNAGAALAEEPVKVEVEENNSRLVGDAANAAKVEENNSRPAEDAANAAEVKENNSGSPEDAQVDSERAQTADSSEKRPEDVPLLMTTPGQQELGPDTVRSDDLLNLTTPTSGYSLNLSELSWQTVSGLFLDSERQHSSQLSDELRYKTVISSKPEERDDEIEEVFHRTVVPTLVGAVPMPPRDAEEIEKEESESSLEEKKDKKKLEDVSNSKSFDSDTPFISVEVKTVIETQVLDDEDEEEGRPRVELMVQATVDVEDVEETTEGRQNLPEGEEKDMSEGQEKGGSGESDSTMSSAATEIKRSDSGRRGTGAPGSLMQSQSLDLGNRNPLLRTRSLSTFRHGVTDFEVWNAIEKELEDAATKIQTRFRSYKARKKLQREDAVQITTEESSRSNTPAEADERQQSTGEFHDSIVLSDHPR